MCSPAYAHAGAAGPAVGAHLPATAANVSNMQVQGCTLHCGKWLNAVRIALVLRTALHMPCACCPACCMPARVDHTHSRPPTGLRAAERQDIHLLHHARRHPGCLPHRWAAGHLACQMPRLRSMQGCLGWLCGVDPGAARSPPLYHCWVGGLPQGGARFVMHSASVLTARAALPFSGLSYSTDTAMNQSFYGNKASCTRLPRCRKFGARKLRDRD